jgi:hypothetical protein
VIQKTVLKIDHESTLEINKRKGDPEQKFDAALGVHNLRNLQVFSKKQAEALYLLFS